MNWRVNTNPKEDGEYVLACGKVFCEEEGVKIYHLTITNFTVAYGWNTTNGYANSGYGFEPDPFWSWMPVKEFSYALCSTEAEKESCPEAQG